MTSIATTGVRPSKTSPEFLETNATSHTWIFSAIAELIDNAYDPDVKASQLHINVEKINGYECLTFSDDGNGMNEEQLDKMLSFGYSKKEEIDGHKPIGRYGNGFKSGSMRLGKDALVLTRQAETMSVGLLSQTYLKRIHAETVLIPMVTFSTKTKQIVGGKTSSSKKNLDAILKWSIFHELDELLASLASITNVFKGAKSGTKIIIYELKTHCDSTGELELCFDVEKKDIINRSCSVDDADYRRSLRKYCSILYLKPRMKIFLMGKKVVQRLIAKDLCKTETDYYAPKWAAEGRIKITFGFNPKSRDQQGNKNEYGIMIYHKNRLIQAYEKVGYQRQPNELGVGVVGVIEVDYLTPIHNKQSFNYDPKYMALCNNLATKLNQYWDTKMGFSSSQPGTSATVPEDIVPDCNWVMCDNCNKWRRLPPGVGKPGDDDVWYCENNPDVEFNKCDIPEEGLLEGEVDVPGAKPYLKRKKKNVQNPVRNTAGNVKHLKEQMEAERAKYERRRTAQKAQRATRRQFWMTVERNFRDLTLHTRAMMAEMNVSNDDVVDEVADDSERVLQCAKCQSWRLIPENFHFDAANETFTCESHPNLKIRQLCDEFMNSETTSDDGPSPPKRIKTEVVDLDEVVDLTQEDDVLNEFRSDDDENEHEESKKENDDLNAMQSQVYDLTKKLNVIRRICVKVKTEKSEQDCQTEISMASCPKMDESSFFETQQPLTSSSSPIDEENRLLRLYASKILKLIIPLPSLEIDPTTIVDLMKSVCESNEKEIKKDDRV